MRGGAAAVSAAAAFRAEPSTSTAPTHANTSASNYAHTGSSYTQSSSANYGEAGGSYGQSGAGYRQGDGHSYGESGAASYYAEAEQGSERCYRAIKDDGRTEGERWTLAEEMLGEQAPYTMQASPALPLTYVLRSYAVAWRVEGEDGEWQWMPYCAGRRRPGEEEESDF